MAAAPDYWKPRVASDRADMTPIFIAAAGLHELLFFAVAIENVRSLSLERVPS